MPDVSAIVPNFHGNFPYGLDANRRVMVPAIWRPKKPGVLFTVILWPIKVQDCLMVLPPERWKVMLDKLKTKSLQDKRVAAFERTIGSTSAQLTLDRVGRFCLPEHLIGPAQIDKDVMFAGRLDKFEIWNPERLKAATAEDKAVAAELVEGLDL